MSAYFLPEPRKLITVLEVTLETNLPDDGVSELVVSWLDYASTVCKAWQKAGGMYDAGQLRVIGGGCWHIIPYGTKEGMQLYGQAFDQARKHADGL